MKNSPLFAILATTVLSLAAGAADSESDLMLFQSQVPQAQSRKELNSFLDLAELSEPKEVVARAFEFREQFKDSEFLAQTYRIEMRAWIDLGDYQKAILAGEQSLKRSPDDMDTLVKLANILPDGVDQSSRRDEILGRAEAYARRALAGISSLKATRSTALETWLKVTGRMKAQAHCALGLISLKRKQGAASVHELEMCTTLDPDADGAQFYMLGVAYTINGNRTQAAVAFQRASVLGPDAVRTRAEMGLAALADVPPSHQTDGKR